MLNMFVYLLWIIRYMNGLVSFMTYQGVSVKKNELGKVAKNQKSSPIQKNDNIDLKSEVRN